MQSVIVSSGKIGAHFSFSSVIIAPLTQAVKLDSEGLILAGQTLHFHALCCNFN